MEGATFVKKYGGNSFGTISLDYQVVARNPSLGEQEEAVQAGAVDEGAPTGPNRPRKGLKRRIPWKYNIAPRSTAWTPPPALEGRP